MTNVTAGVRGVVAESLPSGCLEVAPWLRRRSGDRHALADWDKEHP